MNYYNSETLLEQQQEIEKLQEQNAALAAQVEMLRSKVFETYNFQLNISTDNFTGVLQTFELIGECFEIAKATPQKQLAEIRTQAWSLGFDCCDNLINENHDAWYYDDGFSALKDEAANQYADSIRQEKK